MPLLKLNMVTRSYAMGDEKIVALDKVCWSIKNSDYVAITGTSGSGKSTMMNIIGCLETPDDGQYLFEGKEITSFKADELATFRNRTIGFVFQQFNLLPYLSALDNVVLPLRYAGKTRSESVELAMNALQEVGLAKRAQSKPSQLSGGQQQRVAIARAIVNSPRLILADEPTGALDSKTANEILELFQRLSAKGVAIVMVTHDMELAARAARITRLSDGRIVSDIRTR